MKQTPTIKRVNELLLYDQNSGDFLWRSTLGSRAQAGKIAGSCTKQGYRVIRLDGELWRAHHLAWLVHYGRWPEGLVVHHNKNPSDNRICNLALATKKEAHAHTKAKPISAANVHDIFTYDNGLLRWKSGLPGKNHIAGAIAGSINEDGYVVVETAGKSIGVHRVVWLMHHDQWPQGEIDHCNGVRADNRIQNLRDVIHRLNTENRKKAGVHSKSGLLGVEQIGKQKYRARIRSQGRLHELGTFSSPHEAHNAYIFAKRALHEGNTL